MRRGKAARHEIDHPVHVVRHLGVVKETNPVSADSGRVEHSRSATGEWGTFSAHAQRGQSQRRGARGRLRACAAKAKYSQARGLSRGDHEVVGSGNSRVGLERPACPISCRVPHVRLTEGDVDADSLCWGARVCWPRVLAAGGGAHRHCSKAARKAPRETPSTGFGTMMAQATFSCRHPCGPSPEGSRTKRASTPLHATSEAAPPTAPCHGA